MLKDPLPFIIKIDYITNIPTTYATRPTFIIFCFDFSKVKFIVKNLTSKYTCIVSSHIY